MRLFYLIWVDCLVRLKSQPSNRKNWKVLGMIFMSVPMSVNLLLLVIVLEKFVFGRVIYDLKIPVLPAPVGEPIAFAVLYLGPPLILNYTLIFRKQRYQKLIKIYKYNDGKFFAAYLVLSMAIPVLILWAGVVFGLI